MRMQDIDTGKPIKKIGLFLTVGEAKQMRDFIEALIGNYGKQGQHIHVSDNDYKHEVTVALYDPADLNRFEFQEICMKLLHDKL
jgi:hypothetical protein